MQKLLGTVALTLILLMHLGAQEPAGHIDPTSNAVIEQTSSASRFYGGVDYLLWWVKAAPLSVPLVSTGPVATTHHGLLGPPAENGADSTVLYGASHAPAKGGNDAQNFPAFSGARIKLGYWLDADQHFGIEGGGFLLESKSAGFEARGDSAGNPILGIPVANSVPYSVGSLTIRPGEDSLPFSLPNDPSRVRGDGILTGGVNIKNSLQLWGADAAGVINFYRSPSWEFSGIGGVRYLDLYETFDLTTDIEGVSGPYTGESGVASDRFQTRNQFYGGNLGMRGRYTHGRLSAELSGFVALGVSHEVENVNGGFVSTNFPSPTSSGPEGIFAQPANEGRSSTNRFAVVPEVQIKIGYALTSRLKATIGYDFLYYSNVLRPTDQIDRNIPKGQTFNQADPIISTTSPSRRSKTSDFFANGLSIGMEFSF